MPSCFLVYAVSADGKMVSPLVLSSLWDIDTGKEACLSREFLMMETKDRRIYMVYDVKIKNILIGKLPQSRETNWLAVRLLVERNKLELCQDCSEDSLPQGDMIFFQTDKKNTPTKSYALQDFESDWKHLFCMPQLYMKIRWFDTDHEIIYKLFGMKTKELNAHMRQMIDNIRLGRQFYLEGKINSALVPFPKYMSR
jgi:hypothetical protein